MPWDKSESIDMDDLVKELMNNKSKPYTKATKYADLELLKIYAPEAYASFIRGVANEIPVVGYSAIPHITYDDSAAMRDLTELKLKLLNLEYNVGRDIVIKGARYMQSLTKVKITHDGTKISAAAPEWEYVNFGTRPHKIRPKNAKVLKFYPAGASVAVFSTYVNHPGNKAVNFVKSTVKFIEREIDNHEFK